MSIRLEAPFANPLTISFLPNPVFSDNRGSAKGVDIRQSMDGTFYSYVSTGGGEVLTFTFSNLSRPKIIELQRFIKEYAAEEIRLVDFRNDYWRVKLLTNPSAVTMNNRSDPFYEEGSVTLEFEGEKL